VVAQSARIDELSCNVIIAHRLSLASFSKRQQRANSEDQQETVNDIKAEIRRSVNRARALTLKLKNIRTM